MTRYTEEQKAVALQLYEKLGLAEAARQTRIPKGTISSWAARSGLQAAHTSGAERTRAAREESAARIEVKRALLRELLIDAAIVNVERTKTETKGVNGFAIAAGILIDKFRLESGEASGVFQQLTKQQALDDGKTRATQLRPVREAS